MITNNGAWAISNYCMINANNTVAVAHKFKQYNGVDSDSIDMQAIANIQSCFPNPLKNIELSIPSTVTSGGVFMRLGTGTTAPSKSDYTLENIISNADMNTSTSVVGISPNGSKVYTYTFQNTTNAPITVTEVGLYLRGKSSYYSLCILLTREVIDPKEVGAGKTATFTYELLG